MVSLNFHFIGRQIPRDKEIPKSSLSAKTRQIMEVLEQLPIMILTWKIMQCYISPKPAKDISGEFTFFHT